MVSFFVGLLSLIAMFAICFATAVGISYLKNCYFPKQAETVQTDTPEEFVPQDVPTQQSVVYYITKPKPVHKKKRPKTHTIPIKGAIAPKGTVVITAPEILEKPGTAKRKTSAVKKQSEVKSASKTKAETISLAPSLPRPKAVRGDRTTSARR